MASTWPLQSVLSVIELLYFPSSVILILGPQPKKLDSVPYIEVDCQLCTAAEGAGGRRQYIYTFAKTQICKQAAVTVFGKQAATQYFASRHCHIYWQIASTVITCGISIVRTAIYKADQVAIKEKALSSCSGIV